VFAYTLGKKQLLRDHAFSQFLCILRGLQDRGFRETFPVEFIAFGRIETARTTISCDVHVAAARAAGPAAGERDSSAGGLSANFSILRGNRNFSRPQAFNRI
jgi:hypothetical protein